MRDESSRHFIPHPSALIPSHIESASMKRTMLVLLALLAAVANARTIEIDDLMRDVSVSDPQISPDGKWIACVVSRPNVTEDRFEPQIVLVDVGSGKQRTLTYDRKHVNSPRWSPAG